MRGCCPLTMDEVPKDTHMVRTLVRSLSLVAILAGTAAAAGDPMPPAEAPAKAETTKAEATKAETTKTAKKKSVRKTKKKAARKNQKKKAKKAAKAKNAAKT